MKPLRGPETIPYAEIGVDVNEGEKVVTAIVMTRKEKPEREITITTICNLTNADPETVKKVMFYFVYTGDLLPKFREFCSRCGHVGDKRKNNVYDLRKRCIKCGCYLDHVISFWHKGNRPEDD